MSSMASSLRKRLQGWQAGLAVVAGEMAKVEVAEDGKTGEMNNHKLGECGREKAIDKVGGGKAGNRVSDMSWGERESQQIF